MKRAVLEVNGKKYTGVGFGAPGEYKGELVFNTAMTGYVEALTDPSYGGQILMFTYPLIGNYGVSRAWMQSKRVQVAAVIVHEMCEEYRHPDAECSLDEFLSQEGIGGIQGVDTRALTLSVRQNGTMSATVTVSL